MLRSPLSSALASSRQWICKSCSHKELLSQQRQFFTRTSRLRQAEKQNSSTVQMDAARAYFRHRNITLANYTLSVLIGVLALSYASVPLYKTVCQTMGWGGQPVKSKSHLGPGSSDDEDEETALLRVTPRTDSHRIRITFSGSTSSVLPWEFTPQQREVRVLPGETALAFYTATNTSKDDIIGVATYSVTPGQVAPYFSKIQCFCFDEQRLNAGETVDMPVFFYIDPDIVNDMNTRKIESVTLHYTFFKAKYDKDGHLNPVPMGR